jgi:beta-lactamase superfamily II metal-dependent hydrolase
MPIPSLDPPHLWRVDPVTQVGHGRLMTPAESAMQPASTDRGHLRRFYGRIEYVVASDIQGDLTTSDEESYFVLIDAVDASWDGFASGPFNLESGAGREYPPTDDAWPATLVGARDGAPSLADAPIVRVDLGRQIRTDFDPETDEEHDWVEFDLADTFARRGTLYRLGSMSESPDGEVDEGSNVGVGPISASEFSDSLDRIFGMNSWPSASTQELRDALCASSAASQVISFDVGQGGANAFIDTRGFPRLYFDLGRGVRQNSQTSPTGLEFCNCKSPTIILSHWDEDHWAGARSDTKMLASTWIVPRQRIGPTHLKFAQSILSAGGDILVFDSQSFSHAMLWDSRRPGAVSPRPHQQLSLEIGAGRSRNDSGIVLRLHDLERDLEWVLPGDASYDKIRSLRSLSPTPIVAVSASHHGANQPRVASTIPAAPMGLNYRRILYSFGEDNSYSHPREPTVRINAMKDWRHIDKGSGLSTHGADALSTYRSSPAKERSSIGAGWRQRPYEPHHLLACLPGFSVIY